MMKQAAQLMLRLKIKSPSPFRQADGLCHHANNASDVMSRGGPAIWNLSWWAVRQPTSLALYLSYAELTDRLIVLCINHDDLPNELTLRHRRPDKENPPRLT